ncbi:MAG: hypothetical protein LBQ75_05465 [Zoogloeaceae bacterium]|jgi:hypothetical protein|nr:hypothetical protein [Zoogloeaceae bacterium]
MRSRWFRRLHHYSGIRADKLVILPSAIGYYQLAIAAVIAMAFFLLGYGANVITRSPEERNVADLQAKVAELQTSLDESGSALTSLEMTRSAKRGLEDELRSISSDLAVVKDDLAYFLGLVPVGTQAGEVQLERLSIRSDPNIEGQYRYSVLVGYNAGRQTIGFTGRLQFLLDVERNGQKVQIVWPDPKESGMLSDFRVQTHQWVRKEGLISLAPNDVLKKAELLLFQGDVRRTATSVTF